MLTSFASDHLYIHHSPGKAISKECVQLERWDKWVGMFSQDLWTVRTETPSGEFTSWESVTRICMQTRAAMKPRNSCIPGWGGYRNLVQTFFLLKNFIIFTQIRSDQISHSVVSNSLQPHESQHARPPCPSQTPGVHPDSRPSSQ